MREENTRAPWEQIEALLEELADGQKSHLLQMGRRIVPTLTPEDMLQPNDYPELENHPEFRYEEGILAGILTVQAAFRGSREFLGRCPKP
jgi:hypothetical protein